MPPAASSPLILFVCTGNVCRSPLAERLLAHYLDGAGRDIRLGSAGTSALVGAPMDPGAEKQLVALGGQGEGHRARQLSVELLDDADLVLTATRAHRSRVVETLPGAVHRTFTVRQLGRLLTDAPRLRPRHAQPDPVAELLSVAARQRGLNRPADPADDDVDDPYRRSRKDQQRSAGQQAPALQTLAAFLAS